MLKNASLNKVSARWKVLPAELPQVKKYEVRYRPVPGQRKETAGNDVWIMISIANTNSIIVEAELTSLFPDCEYEAAARVSNGFAWGEWSDPSRSMNVTEAVRRLAR